VGCEISTVEMSKCCESSSCGFPIDDGLYVLTLRWNGSVNRESVVACVNCTEWILRIGRHLYNTFLSPSVPHLTFISASHLGFPISF
jgi:hypothetical protein